MKKLFTISLVNLLVIIGLTNLSVAQQTYYYDFRNTLNESSGNGPALNVLGTGAFVNVGLPELSCISRPVYGFTQNSGVQFDNTVAGNFIGESYSIEMYFQTLSTSGFRRIIDYKNRTSDFGLYSTETEVQFYDLLAINTTLFVANQFVYLAVTRDSASEVVSLYFDGAFAGSFIDTAGDALLDTSNVLNFFQDDLVFGGEARPGRIALLNLHNFTLDANTIADNYNSLEATSGTLAFTPDITSACLTGNVFNFTNNSLNAGGYSYTWDFGDGNTLVDTNATYSYGAAGNYTVMLIADNGAGCADTVAVQVQVLTTAPIDLGPDAAICTGDSLTLDAGPGFVSYLWNTGSTGQTIVVSNSGIYTAEVIDSAGCNGIDSIVVDVLGYPTVELGADTIICFGETVTLAASPGLIYLWSTGETTETISVNTPGVYTVEVANIAGCSATDSISVSVLPMIVMSIGNDTSLCDGNILTLDPGPGFIDYMWSDGSVFPTLDVTASGSYSVIVTDQFGCTATDSINVTVNPLPVFDLGVDTTFCGGTSVLLDPGSFTGYLWNTGSQNPTLNVTQSGTYSVVVTDLTGCTGTDSITLTATPVVDLGPDQVWCAGLSTVLDAGNGNFTYLWNDGSATQTIMVNASGTYTVTVTDNNGCVNSDEITVAFNNIPVFDLGPDFSICDGEIAMLDPGSGYYAYLWNDGSASQIFFATTAGTYIVTVSSAPNCDATDSITIGVLPVPALELGADTALCDGGMLTLDAGSGLSSYLWSDGTSNQTLSVTTSGIYAVTITDSLGCENTDSIQVNFEAPPMLELGPDLTICSGTATVLDAGPGMASYLWSDGSTTQMLLAATPGTYAVTITSTAGCIVQDSVTVFMLNSPVVSLGADTTLCDGASILLDAGPGFNSYQWNNGSITQTLNVTVAGIYTIMVTDTNNCSGTDDIEIMYYAPVPTPSITQLGNTLISSAATGNQWYANPGGLIPGATGTTYNPGANGTFYVIVTDSNGCASAPSPDFIFIFSGLNDPGQVSFELYPNPASSQVTINTTGWDVRAVTIEMIDMIGKTILAKSNVPVGKFHLDVSTFPEGIYFIKVSAQNYQSVNRLMINR